MTTTSEFKSLVGNAQWDLNYEDFCQRAQFPHDSYAEAKWAAFQNLANALREFDDNTLARIVGEA